MQSNVRQTLSNRTPPDNNCRHNSTTAIRTILILVKQLIARHLQGEKVEVQGLQTFQGFLLTDYDFTGSSQKCINRQVGQGSDTRKTDPLVCGVLLINENPARPALGNFEVLPGTYQVRPHLIQRIRSR